MPIIMLEIITVYCDTNDILFKNVTISVCITIKIGIKN